MNEAFASNLIKYFELIAGIIGIVVYYKSKHSIWFYLAVYLVVLFGMECTGYWFLKMDLYRHNIKLYKFLVIPSLFSMYHYVFYRLLNKHELKVLLSLGIFLSLVFLENTLLNSKQVFSISVSVAYGCLAVSIGAIIYLLRLVKTDEILYFKQNMGFWFCTGLLIFYIGSFLKLTFFNSLVINKASAINHILTWLFIVLNYIMYTLFAIGFICSKPK